jgi:hypothetical protein
MRKRIQPTRLLLVALCATGLAGVTARGAEFKLASHERGKIESVDTTGKTLTVAKAHSKNTEVFTWNDNTAFQQREHLLGKSLTVTATDLKPSEHVNIEYYKEGDHLVAKKITLSHENHAAGTATQLNRS